MNTLLRMELPARVENTCVYVQVQQNKLYRHIKVFHFLNLVQVHSISVFGGVSNWSTPVCVAIGEFVVTMTTDLDATATTTTQQSATTAGMLSSMHNGLCLRVQCIT